MPIGLMGIGVIRSAPLNVEAHHHGQNTRIIPQWEIHEC